MKKPKIVSGFSKLSKRGKIRWLAENFFSNPEEVARELKSFWYGDPQKQKIFASALHLGISSKHSI